jgi:hypothetical protein
MACHSSNPFGPSIHLCLRVDPSSIDVVVIPEGYLLRDTVVCAIASIGEPIVGTNPNGREDLWVLQQDIFVKIP